MSLRPTGRWKATATAAGIALAVLAGCGSGNGATASGAVTLDYYAPPDVSGSYQQAADNCTAAADGRYRIAYHKLPAGADGQRQQLVRRLAAADTSMDILGIDVTWIAELAEAGWIDPWPADRAAQVSKGTLPSALETGTWDGELYAAPFVTNVQLLWYRSDLVPKPPRTWDEMIDMATNLAAENKPHLIEIQGAQYEGVTVWFNTLVSSAGGSVLTEDSSAPSLGDPALKALTIMKRLADSAAADPSLSNQMEDQNRLAMEGGRAAFELNWPYVWPSMQASRPTADGVQLADVFSWAPYPSVLENEPARVTTGGLDLAVSHYSQHRELAFEAAACMRSRDNQRITAVQGGLSPTLEEFYLHPDVEFQKLFPFYEVVYAELQNAVNRPKTPAYQSVSIVISHLVSPPRDIDPQSTLQQLQSQITDALASKGLVP